MNELDTDSQETLFAEWPRSDASYAGEEESTWAFLERVDDRAFNRVRRLMNAWYSRYPAGQRAGLRGRLACGDDVEFHSAWFELYLHELHRRLGFDVAVEPNLPEIATHPDFLLKRNGERLLLEATVVGNRQESGRSGRIARIVAAVNRTRSPDFTLLFEIESEGERSPSMRGVRRRLESWLAELGWSEERAAQECRLDIDALPACTERVGDWVFFFRAWARRPEDRGVPGPAISVGPSDGGVFDHGGDLLHRLTEKAGKYGTPSEPVVIAVRLDRLAASADDVRVALMGPAIGRFDPSDPTTTTPTGRHGAGFFRHASGRWRNRHVAGVLVWDIELRPWSVARRAPILWLHSQPDHPLPSSLPWRRVKLEGDVPEVAEGTFDPARAFELPDVDEFQDPAGWPGTPFANGRG